MADDKLGTLEYDMLINEEKLTKQLQNIDKLLKEQDDKWRKALSNIGSGSIGNIDTSKLITANKAIETGTTNLKTSIKQLKKELSDNVKTYEAYSQAQRENTNYAKATLATIQEQKDKLAELGVTYRAVTAEKRAAAREEARIAAESNKLTKLQSVTSTAPDEIAKLRAINKELEYKRTLTNDKTKLDSLNREIVANQRLITTKKEESKVTEKLITQAAARQKQMAVVETLPQGSLERIKEYIKYLELLRRQSTDTTKTQDLTKQITAEKLKRDQLIATLKQEKAQRTANLQEEKLQAAVNAQQVGSIGRLRAEYALLVFQLGQVGKTIPYSTDKIRELNRAMVSTKQQINALQPTSNIWNRLTASIKTYVAAYLSVQAVIGLGRAVFRQTKELDQLAFSMRTVIQNGVELANTQKFLSEVAVNYGGDLLTLSERYIKFRAAAIQSNVTADETQKIFNSVSKAAGTLGLKTDELSGVYLALEQMLSKGKVTTEELRRQLGERLPGAFGIMANALGVTIPQLDKMLKKGEVLSTEALPYFAAALEKAYGIESLKKIDTLAAAQGRMSTQFTELIRSVNGSDFFKDAINGIANALKFLKDNINVIAFFAKALITATLGLTTFRIASTLNNAIQRTSILLFKTQIPILAGIDFAQKKAALSARSAAAATNSWARAMNILKVAFATNPLGVFLVIATTLLSVFTLFGKRTKEVVDAMSELNKQESSLNNTLAYSKKVLEETAPATERYQNALKEINNIAIKYNQELLTIKSSTDDINKSIQRTIELIKEEYLEKRRVAELDKARADFQPAEDAIRERFFEYYKDANEAYDKFLEFQQLVKSGATLDDVVGNFIGSSNWTAKTNTELEKAIIAIQAYYQEVARIEAQYGKGKEKPVLFDLEGLKKDLAAAKTEFENVTKIGAENIAEGVQFFDAEAGIKTYKDYLNKRLQLIVGSSLEEKQAREAILLEIADLEKTAAKKDPYEKLLEKRNEAIDELNKKYLQDKEDFVNADLGISAGRIAALEDGIEKEKKLNELAYQNRLKAIDKETEAGLKLVNQIAGTENKPLITSLDFDVSSYSPEVQDAINKLRFTEATKIGNAARERNENDLAITEKYAEKIKEIQRDVSDQFLRGVEKEKAAINEKYDDWAKQAELADPQDLAGLQAKIAEDRNTALNEVDRRFQLDQLDFFREIEYKKNEIAVGASLNRRKLDRLNFDTYVKYEKERIRILRQSGLKDNLTLADQSEQSLLVEQDLENTRRKIDLQQEIINGSKQLTSILAEQLGLSKEEADVLTGVQNVVMNVLQGNYIGAAVSAIGTVISAIGNNKQEDPTIKALEHINSLLQTQSIILSGLSDVNYFELAKKQYEDYGKAIELNNKKLRESNILTNEEFAKARKYFDQQIADFPNGPIANAGWQRFIDNRSGESQYWTPQQFIDAYTSGSAVLNDQETEWVKEIVKLQKERIELLQETFRQTLGFDAQTVADEIFSGIDEGLKLSQNGLGDFSNNFGQLMKKALMQGIIEAMNIRITEGFLTQYREFISATSEEGTSLSANEKKLLEQSYIDIVRQAEIDSANIAAITDKYTSQDLSGVNGLTSSIQSVTEDTARRLEGLMNTIRETTVKNLGNTDALVKSNEMIQVYSAQSLSELRTVNLNLANQLAYFNDWTATAGGTGGKGLKVYVQN